MTITRTKRFAILLAVFVSLIYIAGIGPVEVAQDRGALSRGPDAFWSRLYAPLRSVLESTEHTRQIYWAYVRGWR